MKFRSAFRMALRALGRNKLRTVLTMLGITIGIGAVICTVAIGEGGSNLVREQLVALGTNMVWVEAGGRNINGVRTGNGATKSTRIKTGTPPTAAFRLNIFRFAAGSSPRALFLRSRMSTTLRTSA
jgi:ABC-type antimicrobial peptide transport system permease subunit